MAHTTIAMGFKHGDVNRRIYLIWVQWNSLFHPLSYSTSSLESQYQFSNFPWNQSFKLRLTLSNYNLKLNKRIKRNHSQCGNDTLSPIIKLQANHSIISTISIYQDVRYVQKCWNSKWSSVSPLYLICERSVSLSI